MKTIKLSKSPINNIPVPDKSPVHIGDTIDVPFRGHSIQITYCADKLWRDAEGTVWGFQEDGNGDPVVRCGVGCTSLPTSDPLTAACAPHDYAYSSPAYQEFHTRAEADEMLKHNILLIGRGWRYYMAWPFYALVRVFGGMFWENKKTNI